MKNIRTTVLGILMILGAIANAGVAMFDDNADTVFNMEVTAAAIAGGVGLILVREQKQHEEDDK